ncbi:MAG: hypothetical protein ACOYOU_16345 [Kiritimatiellia bacterium]
MIPILTLALLSAGAVSASDLMIKANTGLPLDPARSKYHAGAIFLPGKDATGLPYWSAASNTLPQYLLEVDQGGPAVTMAWACRISSATSTMPAAFTTLACPNYNWDMPTSWQLKSNEFVSLDINEMSGVTNGPQFNPASGCILDTTWSYHAACYEPAAGRWTWWTNGRRTGSITKPATWTNAWQPGGVIFLGHMKLGGWNVRYDMDRLACWERKLTDTEIHQDYLDWFTQRNGITVDPPYTLSMSVSDLPVNPPDTVTAVTSGDALLRKETKGNTKHDKQVAVQVSRGFPIWGLTVSPTNVATINAAGRITHVDDGAATVTLLASNACGTYSTTNTLSVTLATEGVTVYAYTGGAPGSVRSACLDWIAPRLTNGGDIAGFSTLNHATTNYVRNTNSWARGLDLACVPVWNSQSAGPQHSPTLISPETAIGCNHASLANGTTVRWITTNGVAVERTVTASMSAQEEWPYGDARVFRLSAPITNITPAPMMTGTFTNRFAEQTTGIVYYKLRGYGIPAVTQDQFMRITVRDVQEFSAKGVTYMQPTDTNRLALFQNVISGDSGSPGFLVISNTPVLISVYTFGGPGSGPSMGAYFNSITNAARIMGDTNTITGFNLSGFTGYP